MNKTCCSCGEDEQETPLLHSGSPAHIVIRLRAEYAALAAAHDAAMAEAERTWLRYWDDADRWYRDYHAMKHRAEAAEAQLAAARADGARSMAAFVAEHVGNRWGDEAHLLVVGGGYIVLDAEGSADEMLAAWQAAQEAQETTP